MIRLVSFFLAAALLMVGASIPSAGRAADATQKRDASRFPAAAPALVEGVVTLLDEGFEVGPKKLQAAQKRNAAVRKLTQSDPRLDYAWGLVLLRQSQHKQAVAQFEIAVDRPGEAYWPAWQGLIWGHLADRQYEKGLDRLDAYAELVRKSAAEAETNEIQREAARWMGETIESLLKTVEAKKLRDLIDVHDLRLRDVLGDDLYGAFDLGRDVVDERSLDLAHKAGEALQEAAKKDERRRKSQSSKLDSELEDLDKQKENAAKSTEEWKKWLDDMLGKADKQLGQLEKDYKFLEERAKSLDRSITLLGQELTAMNLQLQAGGGAVLPIQQLQNEQRMIQRQNQMLNYQLEYNATIGRMTQTAQQGRLAMQQRAGIVQKYEKATGDLVKKSAELDKWTTRANDKKQKLDVQQPVAKGKGKSAKAPAERKVVHSFRNYLPLDLDAEKARVLADFGVKGSEPPAVPDEKDGKGK